MIKVFAPASVGNVIVGFDILGACLDQVGDTITLKKRALQKKSRQIDQVISIRSISGEGANLPTHPQQNTASVALFSLFEDQQLDFGFEISIHKGLKPGSGLGSSASSAVGAVLAGQTLLGKNLSFEKLLSYALAGEMLSSKEAHADNVAPSLLGGLSLVLSASEGQVLSLPVPPEIWQVAILPDVEVLTEKSRAILKPIISLKDHVGQSARLGAFVSALYENNYDQLAKCMKDILIEPQRKKLIPFFDESKNAALNVGAIGFSIGGSGPCLYAWTRGETLAQKVLEAVSEIFIRNKIKCQGFLGPIPKLGARVIG